MKWELHLKDELPPFWNSIEPYKEYKMADKRTYKENLATISTQLVYIESHLRNIDGHLEKINTTNLDQEVKIARNKDRIGLGYKIGGGLFSVLSLALVALVLRLLGVY